MKSYFDVVNKINELSKNGRNLRIISYGIQGNVVQYLSLVKENDPVICDILYFDCDDEESMNDLFAIEADDFEKLCVEIDYQILSQAEETETDESS